MSHPLKYLYFKGCQIPFHLQAYDLATRAACNALDIELIDMEFNCCGYPVRHQDFDSFIVSAARNLALAETKGLPMLTPCKCCFGSFKHAQHWLGRDERLRQRIEPILAKERLSIDGETNVEHLLTVLARQVGPEAIQRKVTRPLKGIKIAPHYGCHALRPSAITGFDNPLAPSLFESLIGATGAEAIDWPLRTECCGNPLWEKNNRLSLRMTRKKIDSALAAEADLMVTGCTYCQLQFETLYSQENAPTEQPRLPVLLYPQLLGVALGLSPSAVGLSEEKMNLLISNQ